MFTFHASVLKPNFDRALRQFELVRQIAALRPRHVALFGELFLQQLQLLSGERGAIASRIVVHQLQLVLIVVQTQLATGARTDQLVAGVIWILASALVQYLVAGEVVFLELHLELRCTTLDSQVGIHTKRLATEALND